MPEIGYAKTPSPILITLGTRKSPGSPISSIERGPRKVIQITISVTVTIDSTVTGSTMIMGKIGAGKSKVIKVSSKR